MASSSKKYTPKPSVSNFNKDVHANEILKFFNDSVDKNRMEVTSQFDQSTSPSVIPAMKGGGCRKANGGK